MNLETVSENFRPMDESVKADVVTYQYNEASIEAGMLPERSIAAASANFIAMDEAIKSDAVPDQYNDNMLNLGYFLRETVLQLL